MLPALMSTVVIGSVKKEALMLSFGHTTTIESHKATSLPSPFSLSLSLSLRKRRQRKLDQLLLGRMKSLGSRHLFPPFPEDSLGFGGLRATVGVAKLCQALVKKLVLDITASLRVKDKGGKGGLKEIHPGPTR